MPTFQCPPDGLGRYDSLKMSLVNVVIATFSALPTGLVDTTARPDLSGEATMIFQCPPDGLGRYDER